MSNHHHTHHPHLHTREDHRPLQRLGTVFWLNLAFVLLETVGSLYLNSMAILADALHDLGDCLALGLAWYFHRLSVRKRDALFSYGYRRFSLLAAVINGLILVGGSLLILRETLPRLWWPQPALNPPGILVLAVIGLIINGLALWHLRAGHSANEKVISLHLLEDVLGWAAVLVGALLMALTGWYRIDSLLAVGLSLWISFNALRGLYQNIGILLQMIPASVDLEGLSQQLLELPAVHSLHDLHSWSLDGEYHIMTLHVVLRFPLTPEESLRLKQQIRAAVQVRGIDHLTLEFESLDEACDLQNC